MYRLHMFASFVIFCCHYQISFCHTNERRHDSRRDVGRASLGEYVQHGELQGSVNPPTTHSTVQLPPISALSARSEQNATKGRIVYNDLTFLILNERHAILLRNIYSDLRTAAASALNETLTAANTIAPLAELTFRYGAMAFTIGCMVKLCPPEALLEMALSFFEDVMLAMYPFTFGVFWVALWGTAYLIVSID